MGKTRKNKPNAVKSANVGITDMNSLKSLYEVKGVQGHGKVWENQIIRAMVNEADLDKAFATSNTAIHDISKELNMKKPGTHVSVKATGSNTVYFGDARRVFNSVRKQDSPLEAIIVKYKQRGEEKVPVNVVQIDMTAAKDALLGSLEDEDFALITEVDELVKRGSDYNKKLRELQQIMRKKGAAFRISAKKGNPISKRPGRTQFYLSSLPTFVANNPSVVIENTDCSVYGEKCLSIIKSSKRVIAKKAPANQVSSALIPDNNA
jgi:hypothetical protein